MTLDDWIRAHPFLRPLADLHRHIDAAIAAHLPSCPPEPDWDAYDADFAAGIPLLDSGAGVYIRAIEPAINRVTVALDRAGVPADPGLRELAGWMTIAATLRPLLETFGRWRDENRWMRPRCPFCGALPTMAQLAGVDSGRQRFLVCGACATRWRYGRTTCPFCEEMSHRLSSLAIDGEGGLRIDYCERCRAYLKTYNGHGDEAVLLADWTSLHLDLAAQTRGWRRRAQSLYAVDTNPPAHPRKFGSDSGSSEAPGGSSQAARP